MEIRAPAKVCDRRRRPLRSIAVLGGALLAVLGSAGTAQASTTTFTYTGAEQTFTVPGGVTSLGVKAIGGAGANSEVSGGEAAEVSGSLTVSPGQTLYVEVGGAGQVAGVGGFNGGGNGALAGGGGGGASDVRTVPRSVALSTEDTRLIVAAGGGGGGGSGIEGFGGVGGGAGEAGAEAPESGNLGGGAGTASTGGSGGSGCGGTGSDGQLGSGADGGGGGGNGGGGGGGGYYGGGGGSGGCSYGGGGGGGGSSLVPALGLQALTTAAPKIEFSYTLVPPAISLTSPADGAIYVKGEVIHASYTCMAPSGTTLETCEGPVADGGALDTSTAGPHTFKVSAEDADGAKASKEVSYTVAVPPTISISSPANGATFTQNQAVSAIYSCAPGEGTGVKSCSGPIANGAQLDTSTLGVHSFVVHAEDLDGGTASKEVTYTVSALTPPTPSSAPIQNPG